MWWHREPKRLGGLEVDRQLELDRGLDRKLARLLALEDAIGLGRRAPKIIEPVKSVGQQATDLGKFTVWIDDGKTVTSRQRYNLCATGGREAIRHYYEATSPGGSGGAMYSDQLLRN